MPGNQQSIGLNRRGPCPHCGVTIELTAPIGGLPSGSYTDNGEQRNISVSNGTCPACHRIVILAFEQQLLKLANQTLQPGPLIQTRYIWPTATLPRQISPEVPAGIKSEYLEAASVIALSEKASAALSRRCLQLVLRDTAGTRSKDLADQIEEVLPTLPGYLQQQLDAVRNIGNFAAHPMKSKSTGEMVDVEPGEAEWNLDVLDLLFDFYFVQPKIAQEKRAALNKKLADLGKPAMK
jgi:hypothetical protein